jgi:predicted nucleic acid-binding protein
VKRIILDTSVLIRHWRISVERSRREMDRIHEPEVIEWARELIRLWDTNSIVSPVYLEFVAGCRSQHELRLFDAYLSLFEVVDEGNIPEADWQLANRLARRIPRTGENRQLGDCLICAIAKRLRFRVKSHEHPFPC